MPKSKKNHVVDKYLKKWKKVDGRLVEDVLIKGRSGNNTQVIKRHYGNMPINVKRTFKTVTGKFWDTRKKIRKTRRRKN